MFNQLTMATPQQSDIKYYPVKVPGSGKYNARVYLYLRLQRILFSTITKHRSNLTRGSQVPSAYLAMRRIQCEVHERF